MANAHKFKVGQSVRFTGGSLYKRGIKGSYRVVGHLPEEYGDWQYRIQSIDKTLELVVKESQLSVPLNLL